MKYYNSKNIVNNRNTIYKIVIGERSKRKLKVRLETVKLWYYKDEMSYAFTLQQFIEYLEKFRNIEVVL